MPRPQTPAHGHPRAGHVGPTSATRRCAQTKIPRLAARGPENLLIYSATAAFRASTRSVFSHFTPRSSRPMWP